MVMGKPLVIVLSTLYLTRSHLLYIILTALLLIIMIECSFDYLDLVHVALMITVKVY